MLREYVIRAMQFRRYIKNGRYFALCLEIHSQNAENTDDNITKITLPTGYRAEAPHPRLELRNPEILFDYLPEEPPHPDLLALLCLVVYYPFFQRWTPTLFPRPISKQMAEALAEFPLYSWDGDRQCYRRLEDKEGSGIQVPAEGIDPNLTPYRDKGATLLAFGGGLDSTAVKCLFPGAHIVHERDWQHSSAVLSKTNTQTEKGIRELITAMDRSSTAPSSYIIASNNRDLTKPRGWTGWIACIATSLLIANDLGCKNILLGSSLASLLGGGHRFVGVEGREFPNTSMWSRLLRRTVGINLFSPIAGLSEIALVRIIAKTSRTYLKKCIWCERRRGYPCHSCFKCFRRDLLLYDESMTRKTKTKSTSESITSITGISTPFPWERYQRTKMPDLTLSGPTLHYLLIKYREQLPSWLLKRVPDSATNWSEQEWEKEWVWLGSWYLPSLRLVPEYLRTYVYKRIAHKIRPMNEREAARLEKYDQRRGCEKDSSSKIKDK